MYAPRCLFYKSEKLEMTQTAAACPPPRDSHVLIKRGVSKANLVREGLVIKYKMKN